MKIFTLILLGSRAPYPACRAADVSDAWWSAQPRIIAKFITMWHNWHPGCQNVNTDNPGPASASVNPCSDCDWDWHGTDMVTWRLMPAEESHSSRFLLRKKVKVKICKLWLWRRCSAISRLPLLTIFYTITRRDTRPYRASHWSLTDSLASDWPSKRGTSLSLTHTISHGAGALISQDFYWNSEQLTIYVSNWWTGLGLAFLRFSSLS